MEILILALLLFLSDERADLRHTLEHFLSFYRQNRELISIIAGSVRGESGTDPAPAAPSGEKETGPRSGEGAGTADVLEEYLKRRG